MSQLDRLYDQIVYDVAVTTILWLLLLVPFLPMEAMVTHFGSDGFCVIVAEYVYVIVMTAIWDAFRTYMDYLETYFSA